MSQHTCSAGITDSGDITFIPVGFNPWTDLEQGDSHDNFCAFTHCPWCGKSVEAEAQAIGELIKSHYDLQEPGPGVWCPILLYHRGRPVHDVVLLWDGNRLHLGRFSPELGLFVDESGRPISNPGWYLVPNMPEDTEDDE